MTLDFVATSRAFTEGVVAFGATHDLVRVYGADAHRFLQGQLTQDLTSLSPGQTVESLLLSPQGKLDAYLRVRCQGDDEFLLECSEGNGAVVLERLRRFKMRVKVELSMEQREVVLLRGPLSSRVVNTVGPLAPVFPYSWSPLNGFDVFVRHGDVSGETEFGDPNALEVARIRAGEPLMRAELDDKTIPQETPLTPRSVSFTKGCFTGQELVARLDSRGSRVARHLRLIVVKPGLRHRAPYVGEPIMVGDRKVGSITSTAYSPIDDCSYALGYIHRSVDLPAHAVVIAGSNEDELLAEIRELEAGSGL